MGRRGRSRHGAAIRHTPAVVMGRGGARATSRVTRADGGRGCCPALRPRRGPGWSPGSGSADDVPRHRRPVFVLARLPLRHAPGPCSTLWLLHHTLRTMTRGPSRTSVASPPRRPCACQSPCRCARASVAPQGGGTRCDFVWLWQLPRVQAPGVWPSTVNSHSSHAHRWHPPAPEPRQSRCA